MPPGRLMTADCSGAPRPRDRAPRVPLVHAADVQAVRMSVSVESERPLRCSLCRRCRQSAAPRPFGFVGGAKLRQVVCVPCAELDGRALARYRAPTSESRSMARKLKSDKVLFTATLLLVCISVVMVYSASAVMAMEQKQAPYYYLLKQAAWALLGLVLRADRHAHRLPQLPAADGHLDDARGRRRGRSSRCCSGGRSTAPRAGCCSARSASSRPSWPRSP